MVTRIDDIGKYYEELSVKAEQNRAEKEAERVRLANEEAERQRAKRDAQQSELQTLLAKALQKQKEADDLENQKKQEERIKELEKELEKDRIFKTEETLKFESGIKSMLSKINKQ